MKIYEIGTGYTPIPARMGAATEIVVEELTRSLIKLGYDAEIVDIKTNDRAECERPIKEVSVPSVFTKKDVSLGIMHKLKRVAYSVSLAKKLSSIIKNADEAPLVFHFHNQYNLFFFLKLTPKRLRKRVKIIYTVHSYIWHGEWDKIKDTVSKRYFQEIYCVKHADRVFVLNDQTARTFEQHLGVLSERITLIDNGVNTELYAPLKEKERSLRREANLLDGKRVFISVGSVCERKNQLGALKLLAPLMKRDPDIVYLFAGGIIDRDYQLSIFEYAIEQGLKDRVQYFGELCPGADLGRFYGIADAMLFPSKAEGFSLVIIEAMSAGVPVIIPDTLSFKLKDECLRYSDEESFENIIEASILDESERENISERVRAHVKDRYGWDRIASDYISAL